MSVMNGVHDGRHVLTVFVRVTQPEHVPELVQGDTLKIVQQAAGGSPPRRAGVSVPSTVEQWRRAAPATRLRF
jgi:hypothetical protein